MLYKLKFRWGLRGFTENWDGNIRLDKGLLLMARPFPKSRILNVGYNNSVSWESRLGGEPDGIVLDIEAPIDAKLYFSSAVANFILCVKDILENQQLLLFGDEVEVQCVPLAEGTASMVPESVIVGKPCNIRFTFVTGQKGIRRGGGIRLVIPQRTDWQSGKLTARTQSKRVKLLLLEEPLNNDRPMEFGPNLSYQMLTYTIRVIKGHLKYRDRIYLSWNNNIAQTIANDNHLIVFTVDSLGDGVYQEIQNHPSLRIKPDKPSYLRVIAPSLVDVNDKVVIRVYAMDQYHNRVYKYRDMIEIISEPLLFSNKSTIDLHGESQFSVRLKNVSAPYTRFSVKSKKKNLQGISNPMVIRKSPKNKIYWGDLHVHTQHSDGYTTPAFAFAYARDVSALDFTSISDHSPYMTQNGWYQIKKAIAQFNNTGKFIVFLGYETSAYNRKKLPGVPSGDINVYFQNDNEPLYYEGLQVYKNGIFGENTWVALEGDLPFLLKKIKSKNVVLIPHHLYAVDGNSIYSEFGKPPMTLIEIYSEWGSSEYKGNDKSPLKEMFENVPHNFYFQDILAKGYTVGVSGGGDDHNSMPGNLNLRAHTEWPLSMWKGSLSYPSGLTAIYSKGLTRKDLLNGMLKRNTFATTGEHIFLNFQINQAMMGNIVPYHKNLKSITIQCCAAGTNKLKEMTIIKNNKIFFTINLDTEYYEKEIINYNISKGDFYYLRVRQIDNHQAWSSPIWIR